MSRPTAAQRATIDRQRVERVYGVLARVYDGFFDWALGPGRRQAIAALPLKAGDRVLEIGVGTGLSLPQYPTRCRVTGIDISEPMLELARERSQELGRADDLRLMDATALTFADASFDQVVAPYVISVVSEPERVMQEIARVCRPGGRVVVVNQFLSDRPWLGALDRWLTPMSQWLGFRMDVPVTAVTATPSLRLVRERRVNLCGLWRLLEFERVDQ